MPGHPKLAVVEAVHSAILRGEYAPGQRLVEIDLCERFGTSRFIARSALQELSAQGLVEFERNRGARVRAISLAEAIEITEVRRMLEGHLAARAAERATRATSTRACTPRSATSPGTRPARACCASCATRPSGTSSRSRSCPAGRRSRYRSTRRSSRR